MRGFTAGPPVYGSGWTAGILPACGRDGRDPVEIRLPLMTVMGSALLRSTELFADRWSI
jgi:hypothetical protein